MSCVPFPADTLGSDSPFPEFQQDNDFNLYDRETDSFQTTPIPSPSHQQDELTLTFSGKESESSSSSDSPLTPPRAQSGSRKLGTNISTYSPQSPPMERGTEKHSEIPDDGVQKAGMPTLYCICMDPTWDMSMIECHSCHNYFHGNCIGISRQKAALLKHFYCPMCVDRDPSLVTEFSAAKVEREPQVPLEEKAGYSKRSKVKNSRRYVDISLSCALEFWSSLSVCVYCIVIFANRRLVF